jgi:hypothetical protein
LLTGHIQIKIDVVSPIELSFDFIDVNFQKYIIHELHDKSYLHGSGRPVRTVEFESALELSAHSDASGRLFRQHAVSHSGGVRPPEDRCRVGTVFNVRLFGPRQRFERGCLPFASNDHT